MPFEFTGALPELDKDTSSMFLPLAQSAPAPADLAPCSVDASSPLTGASPELDKDRSSAFLPLAQSAPVSGNLALSSVGASSPEPTPQKQVSFDGNASLGRVASPWSSFVTASAHHSTPSFTGTTTPTPTPQKQVSFGSNASLGNKASPWSSFGTAIARPVSADKPVNGTSEDFSFGAPLTPALVASSCASLLFDPLTCVLERASAPSTKKLRDVEADAMLPLILDKICQKTGAPREKTLDSLQKGLQSVTEREPVVSDFLRTLFIHSTKPASSAPPAPSKSEPTCEMNSGLSAPVAEPKSGEAGTAMNAKLRLAVIRKYLDAGQPHNKAYEYANDIKQALEAGYGVKELKLFLAAHADYKEPMENFEEWVFDERDKLQSDRASAIPSNASTTCPLVPRKV
jgi:hypothetical protein